MTYYLNFKAQGKLERSSSSDPQQQPFEAEDAVGLIVEDDSPIEMVEVLKEALIYAYLEDVPAHEVLVDSCFCEGPCVPMGFFAGAQVDALSVSVAAGSDEQ